MVAVEELVTRSAYVWACDEANGKGQVTLMAASLPV